MIARTNDRGFTLVELLMACLIACTLIGALLHMAVTAQHAVRTQGDSGDLQQRLRAATDMMQRDLMAAGSGPGGAALIGTFSPIVPGRIGQRGADPEMSFHDDRISVLYVPDTRSQSVVLIGMGAPDAPLAIDPAWPGCPAGGNCGFDAGDRVLVFQPGDPDGGYDVFTVSDAAGGQILPGAGLSRRYPAGARVSTVVQRTYHLDRATGRLMMYDGAQSDLPIVDHVVDVRFTYFADPSATSVAIPASGSSSCAYASLGPPVSRLQDLGGAALTALTPVQLTDGPACGLAPLRYDADLLRVRRIRVTIRLEAESAVLRGTGSDFANAGSSIDSTRRVPDLQMTFEVSPRNMNLFR